jgi:hypothetical protein
VEFEALTRLDLLAALVRYEEGGGALPEGMRGTGPAEKVAMLEYARTFKSTVRDAVAAHPTAYHDFLSTMAQGGLKNTCLQILCIGNIQCGLNVACKAPILTPCIFVGMCSWIGAVLAPEAHRAVASQMFERQAPAEIILATSKLTKCHCTFSNSHLRHGLSLFSLGNLGSHSLSEMSYMYEQLCEWHDDIHRRAPRLRNCLQQPQMQPTKSPRPSQATSEGATHEAPPRVTGHRGTPPRHIFILDSPSACRNQGPRSRGIGGLGFRSVHWPHWLQPEMHMPLKHTS